MAALYCTVSLWLCCINQTSFSTAAGDTRWSLSSTYCVGDTPLGSFTSVTFAGTWSSTLTPPWSRLVFCGSIVPRARNFSSFSRRRCCCFRVRL